MSDSTPGLARGDEYVVFYRGGPYDGQDDRRISTDGSWDTALQVLVAVDGKETELTYGNPVARELNGQVQVTYTFDPAQSEEPEDLDDRNEF